MTLAVIRSENNPRAAAACILAELIGIPWIEMTAEGPPERLADIPFLIWTEKGDPPSTWLDRPRLVLAIPPTIRQINYMLKIDPPAPLPHGGVILRFDSDPLGEFLTCYRSAITKGPPQHFLMEEVVEPIRKAIHNYIPTVNNLPFPIYKKPWRNEKRALACITGDVDALRPRSFRENLKRWLRGVIRNDTYRRGQAWRAMWRRHYPSPELIIELFNKPLSNHNGKGTLFWAMESAHHLDPQYNISDPGVMTLIKNWCSIGEAGLHGSYSSATHPESLAIQFQRLAEICVPPRGIRQHYLRLEGVNTWLSQASLGLKYDSSLCPRKGIGNTCGISTPFPLFDPFNGSSLNIWQLPVMMMDGALFQYEHSDMVSSFPLIEHHLMRIADAHGCITVLFHPQVMDEKVYPSVYESYKMVLEKVAEIGLEMIPAQEVISWRRSLWGVKPVSCLRDGANFKTTLLSEEGISGVSIITHHDREIRNCDLNIGDEIDLEMGLYD